MRSLKYMRSLGFTVVIIIYEVIGHARSLLYIGIRDHYNTLHKCHCDIYYNRTSLYIYIYIYEVILIYTIKGYYNLWGHYKVWDD